MTDYTEADYKDAHKFSSNHGDKLKNDKICGCFYCLSIFSPSEIQDWIRHKKPRGNLKEAGHEVGTAMQWEYDNELTAFCPFCGVDSVIGESSGYPITNEFLAKMNECWFKQQA